MEVGVTVYQPAEQNKPQLEFELHHSSGGATLSTGLQSKVFEMQQGDVLIVRLYSGLKKVGE